MYFVNTWGSHPDEGNDDCWSGEEFDSLEEAIYCFNNPGDYFTRGARGRFIELDGPDVYDVREDLPLNDLTMDDEDDWEREYAMQQGMCFGCQGYNEARGWDVEED